MLKAVLFDLDGVITDTAEFHFQAWKSMANSIDIDFDREFNEGLKGISRIDSLNKILKYGGVLEKYSDNQKMALANSKNAEYVELLSELKPDAIYPGIKELLDTLKMEEIKIGLTSSSKNGPRILDKLEINHYFDTVVNPALIENGKPAPDIFLSAAEELGVKPEDCIGIEDSESGITAIKDANMFAVGVGTEEVMEKAGADLIYKHTGELEFSGLLHSFKQTIS
ncbi:beta-phosphoglucomutase [Virgibacillus natechei]|uniref:Beta-phosphoglucomutase n=1 Tax=Virgibacillus natechei TaxID=1216297 RepID=A0ABS4IKB3_9BACI|nr:beta-phosphoglucomutase [Virgibacillus natechei]MBP1971354.1 beta-phosphoglucomutase [Virgibacillus natechei]UZD12911.1 beta-phosphoglucomutase [Virgibacillus natechei]